MKNIDTKILDINFSLDKNLISLPENVYAIKVHNIDSNYYFKIAVKHDSFCPNISSSYEESQFLDYLSNLEYKLIEEYYKSKNKQKPENYSTVLEIITNEKGELYRLAKAV
ncbi:hypothetical protein K8354_13545 [Polaribacter litorisediminis]|uniref:hypothetical protein n=1 Tax=Polaribacter litorisediminis TaxID=1908341 RepID=UPI001CBF3D70|nr:hypothetical protein [Polaribacter litorisediminis]UAM97336.1 hypothetical protein K8354_13545 [Polaribacter litorisediminis]